MHASLSFIHFMQSTDMNLHELKFIFISIGQDRRKIGIIF